MRSALPLWLACLCSVAACSNDDSSAPISPGNVFLEITALHPRESDVWLPPRAPDPANPADVGYAGDSGPLVIGCDRRLGVDTQIEHYYLRAPDACGGNVQCGYLVIDIDPTDMDTDAAASAYAAAPSVFVDLGPLDRAGKLEGDHTIRPRLAQTNGMPFTHPYAATPQDLTVTFTSDACALAGAGGGPGEPANAGAGGAP
jgi:hypothetical protein